MAAALRYDSGSNMLRQEGIAGVALAKLFKTLTVPQLKEDLRRFKQIIEAGETPTIAHQPAAAASARQRSMVERGASIL